MKELLNIFRDRAKKTYFELQLEKGKKNKNLELIYFYTVFSDDQEKKL
jgi:hypothetical protein